MLVDDEEPLRELVRPYLEAEGFEVIEASSCWRQRCLHMSRQRFVSIGRHVFMSMGGSLALGADAISPG